MRLIITILIAISSIITILPSIAAADAAELMVLYSNNVNGKTEPCG